jgi:hypothetical protein
MDDREWTVQYNAACDALNEAKAQYKLADSIHCAALEKLKRAEQEVGRLFRQRMMIIDSGPAA